MTVDRWSATLPVPPGYRVGRWEVTASIAAGGWGEVFAGRPSTPCGPGMPAQVALKFLPGGLGATTQQRLMARREAAFALYRRVPRLIRTLETLVVHDAARPALDGATVLVMDLAGDNLRAVLARATPGAPVAHAGRLLVEICEGMAQMHRAGWVHGDLKPANVLIMPDSSVRLADFGLADELDGTHAYLPAAGSTDYLPPEWWGERVTERGMAARPSRDVWAFGVLAHQVLTGGLYPFPGGNALARSTAVRQYGQGCGELRLAEGIPGPWRALIRDCLAPDHASRARYPAARVLARARVAAGDVRATPSPVRIARRLVAAGCLVVVIFVGTGGAPVRYAAGAGSGSRSPAALGGELRPEAPVPFVYRLAINAAGHMCGRQPVTPALIAAMLKVESDFDPRLSSPQTDEYGIARWTPWVFQRWTDGTPDAGASVFAPDAAIRTLGRFLCGIYALPDLVNIPGDPALLLAASYREGSNTVVADHGIPPSARDYTDQVARYIRLYEMPSRGA